MSVGDRTAAQLNALELAGQLKQMAGSADAKGWYDVASSMRKAAAQAKMRMHPADRRQHGRL